MTRTGPASMHLFAYGTLKRGQPRHCYLAGQNFVGPARTRPLYHLYNLGDYPGLVERPDGRSIEGELWDIDLDCFARLDAVEGCGEGLYRRANIQLLPPHDQLAVFSYFYEKSIDGMRDCGTRW
jgi:gamma-glutamylaminecyclotransferase